jgi:hypothetical protein
VQSEEGAMIMYVRGELRRKEKKRRGQEEGK